MDSTNVRFKQLREACGKTQTEWGSIIGISRSGVSEIEAGRRNVTEKHIKFLESWNEKPIDTKWLRTGKGNMFRSSNRNKDISRLTKDLFRAETDSFKYRLMMVLSKLNEDEWELLEDIAIRISKEKD